MASLKRLIYPSVIVGSFVLLICLQSFLKIEFKIISTISLLTTILVVAVMESLLPYRQDWNESFGDRKSDFIFTMIFFPVIVFICQTAIQIAPKSLLVFDLSSLPIAGQSLVGLLAAEFLFYWLHRSFHESSLLWKIHFKHHSVQRIYWMNSGTFNPIDLLTNFFVYCLPFAFLKVDPMAFEYVLYFSAVTGLMEHANIDFKAGVLNYLFNTAELHRWHHSVVIKESQSNYGKALSIFDGLFGTLKYSTKAQVSKVGVEESS